MAGILWVGASAVLFGSQFVLNRLCPDLPPIAYNVTMAFGVLAGSLAALVPLGGSTVAPDLAALALLDGALWAAGNYLLLVAVSRAGIARSYVVINFSAVLSFAGGVVFLGELPGLDAPHLLRLAGAVALVLAGSSLVVTTTARPDAAPRDATASGVRRGLLAALASTVFFAAYNTVTAYLMNDAGIPAGATFATVAPGIAGGALVLALLAPGRPLRAWRLAPARAHLLALAQGLVWAVAMVFILFGWMGVGIALGTSIQVGVQTLVAALWGVLLFRELAGHPRPRAAYVRFAAGAACTVAGIAILTAA